ncbi:type IV secretion system DNA-binding domain-containing protein [Candidatus Saccharibacteria bacterium]|nr:type IV secretion system DNA-binding domain-containing protein [Candidatus Saccharibacteria bacterium]
MSGIAVVVLVFFVLAAVLGGVAYMVYRRKLQRAKSIERGLKMVPLLIHLPASSSDTAAGGRDVREVMREKIAQAEVLYNLIAGTATNGFKSTFYGQRHIALEIIASDGMVHFYAAVPVNLVSVIEKAILTAYPGAKLEETEDHNIFNEQGRLSATMGGELVLKADAAYPIATYTHLERDPLEALLVTLSGLSKTDGAAVQIMVRPAPPAWVKSAVKLTTKLRRGRNQGLKFGVADLAKAAVKAPTSSVPADLAKGATNPNLSQLELSAIEQVEDKTKHPGFEVLIRVLVSAENVSRSQQVLQDLATSFSLFERPGLNGFKFVPALDVQGLVTAFIFRFFPPEMHSSVLNSAELATLFHLPDSQFTPTNNVARQLSKEVDGPTSLSSTGLLLGYNEFRGTKKEIRLSEQDRRRHTYILGQTGTGKSTMLENMMVQDMLSGNGFAFIDPHGDSAEKLLSLVPKNRAEDVIYFNPADMEYPLGLNLFEFDDPMQKDFLIQESLNMLYKLYDPNGTGVIGPRFEQWYRNAALTLMADPNGATFIEIPKVFTDTEYLKQKFKYLKDPTVIDFWTKEMGQTSDYHKSEMLGYFVSKFGAFQQNEMMRNIIGQTKSAFNMRDIMDNKKILIVNLSKGQVGEMNAKLLGMMFVIKFQSAAMSRANMPEADRNDFCLYVDEFQNFSTDSFASILSEARKYRLNLIVGNQFIGQLSNEIRDAVFGNIGTIVAHRMGPDDAEFMVKQLTPVFDASDLMNIPNYHSAVRLLIGGLPSQPFTMLDSPWIAPGNPAMGVAIKQLSAAKFGVAKPVVDADITARLSSRPVVPAPTVQLTPSKPTEIPDDKSPVMLPPPTSVATAPAPVVAPPKVAEAITPMPASSGPVSAVVTPQVEAVASVVPLATAPAEATAQATPTTVAPTSAPVAEVATPAPVLAPMVESPSIIADSADDDAPDPVRTALGQPLPPPSAPAVLPIAEPVSTPAPMPQPVAAPVVIPDAAPIASSMPPIGAPPIALPGESADQVTAPVTNKDTLSIRDITGGERTPVVAPSALDDVELIPPGAEPPVVPMVPVYDPATDPNAGVDLLAAPPPPLANADASSAPTPVAAKPAAVYDPATDPNAAVPLLAADVNMEPVFELPPTAAPALPAEPVVLATPIAVPMPIEPTILSTPEPNWQAGPEPLANPAVESVAAQPVATATADDFVSEGGDNLPIHFIDPSLEAVLERPYETTATPVKPISTAVSAPELAVPPEPASVSPAPVIVSALPPLGAPSVALPSSDANLASNVTTAPATSFVNPVASEALPPKSVMPAPVEPAAPVPALIQTPPPIGAPPVSLDQTPTIASVTNVTADTPIVIAEPPASEVIAPVMEQPVEQTALVKAEQASSLPQAETSRQTLASPVEPLPTVEPVELKPAEIKTPAVPVVADSKTIIQSPVDTKPVAGDITNVYAPAPLPVTEPAMVPGVAKPVAHEEPVSEPVPEPAPTPRPEPSPEIKAAMAAVSSEIIGAPTPSAAVPAPATSTLAKPAPDTHHAEAETVPQPTPAAQPTDALVSSVDEGRPKIEEQPREHPAPMTAESKPESKSDAHAQPAANKTVETKPTEPAKQPTEAKPVAAVHVDEPQIITHSTDKTSDTPKIETHMPVKAAEIVAKTEDTIDELLSTSLIHTGSSRHRLAEPEPEAAAAAETTDGKTPDSGRHWVGSSQPADIGDLDEGETADEESAHEPTLYSSAHQKVIQPPQSVVSLKEELAKELKAEATEMGAQAPTLAAAPSPVPVPTTAPTPMPEPVPTPKPAAAVIRDLRPDYVANANPAPRPLIPTPPPAPVVASADDFDLPEATSLAADDVAAARMAQRAAGEARAAAIAAVPPPRSSSLGPASTLAQPVHPAKQNRHHAEQRRSTPKPAPAPVAPKRVVEPEPMTGKLILPNAAAQAANSVPKQVVRPEKLAKGEVFVDASGNVVVGE